MVLALGACSPDVSGAGTGLPGKLGDDESDDAATVGITGLDATVDGGASASGATSTPPGDDTADGPSSDGAVGDHPAVTISHGPVFDFGSCNLGSITPHTFTVSNEGDGDATAVQPVGVGDAFSIASHDCGEVLAPGATCSVEVRFEPNRFGDVDAELQVAYQDEGLAASATRRVVGRGVGVTGNLLINGGGELGNASDIPPTGWTIVYGPNWSASWNAATPFEGNRTISAGYGPPGPTQFTLVQQMHATPLTSWGDASGVRFYYRAFHRAESAGNDPTWVVLRFIDSGGAELSAYPSAQFSGTTWNESAGNVLAPASTHHVQLVLECTRVYNNWCSGFFDGLEVWAEWLG
jgi:hypothetical protein